MTTQGRIRNYGTRLSRLVTVCAAFMVVASPFTTIEPAQGEIVTLHVSGTVTKITQTDRDSFDLDGSVTVGSRYQLTFVIDTDAPDSDPRSDSGLYLLVASSGQFGNYAWSRTEQPVKEIHIKNDFLGYVDEYHLEQHNPEFTGTLLVGGVPTVLAEESFELIFAGVFLSDENMTALDSDSLVIPTLADWGDEKVFGMNLQLDEDVTGLDATIFIDGTVDSITTPEPACAVVMGGAALGLMPRRGQTRYELNC